jgi:hypothetical protein
MGHPVIKTNRQNACHTLIWYSGCGFMTLNALGRPTHPNERRSKCNRLVQYIAGDDSMKFTGRRQAMHGATLAFGLMLISGLQMQARAQTPAGTDAACKAYVQKFYDYYVKESNKESKGSPDIRAIQNKDFAFSQELKTQLKEDNAASAKSAGEIVGLDFDPFLNSQEQPERYVVKEITHKGDHYLAAVYTTMGGKKEAKPAVTPELTFRDNQWTFVNFHYGKSDIPENENLLLILKVLKKDRTSHK